MSENFAARSAYMAAASELSESAKQAIRENCVGKFDVRSDIDHHDIALADQRPLSTYATTYDTTVDGPLNFALFGLDRDMPVWVNPDWNFPVLDLGPGNKLIPGAVRLDWPEYDWEPIPTRPQAHGKGIFLVGGGLELKTSGQLPYDDNYVGGIFCVNLLEHLWDPRPLIWEMARVLRPGCPINVFVPHADSIMYKQDLDHKKQFVLDSWRNLLDPHPYYEKGHAGEHGLIRGAEFKFAVKEGNEACVAQLIKKG